MSLEEEVDSLKGYVRRLEKSNEQLNLTLHKINLTLRDFHTTPATHLYECIGYSEGQRCCADQFREELVRQQRISGG